MFKCCYNCFYVNQCVSACNDASSLCTKESCEEFQTFVCDDWHTLPANDLVDAIQALKTVEIDPDSSFQITQKELDKPEFHLLDWDVIKKMASVATFGARKHINDDFATNDIDEEVYFSKVMRHMIAGKNNENDPETTLSHYINAMVDIMITVNQRSKRDEKD